MSIEKNASIILNFLNPKGTGNNCSGDDVSSGTKLTPEQINDAVEVLESNGYVDLLKVLGTAPYRFGYVAITPHGRFALERALADEKSSSETVTTISRAPEPIGSPYGFQDGDWEYITGERDNTGKLKVVLGYQFESEHYNSHLLADNLKATIQIAVQDYNADPKSIEISLDFIRLGAGFGEHVFNEIARDIISADIAIFDTSNLNPNVMLEMGVALTWGVRVLPIRSSDCPPPPSDISGQTWATYSPKSNAKSFEDTEFQRKLLSMVKRAAQKKVR